MFIGVIDTKKNQSIWSKSILSLSVVSEIIDFEVTTTGLCLSVTNSTNTSHASITFNSDFFHEFTVDLPTSFLINSKHLSTLFKDTDLLYICLKVYESKHKLYLELKLKNGIIKKFQSSYLSGTLSIPIFTRSTFFSIDLHILKSFTDSIPHSTQDFKIISKNNKITFNAYTNQILNEKNYLKMPMSSSILLHMDDLINNNINTETNQIYLNFQFKEFRNFINLSSSINIEDYISIFLDTPENPILFELKLENVTLNFVQTTNNDLRQEITLPPKLPMKVTKKISNPIRKNFPEPVAQTATNSRSSSPENFITYDEQPKRQKLSGKEKAIIFNKATQYSESDEDENIDIDLLGPTQKNTKLKSIFD